MLSVFIFLERHERRGGSKTNLDRSLNDEDRPSFIFEGVLQFQGQYLQGVVYKYEFINKNVQIRIFKYKFTNKNLQIRIYKLKLELELAIRIFKWEFVYKASLLI